jgi:hypothetical protein
MSTEAVLVADPDAEAEREEKFIDRVTKIRACLLELIDNGPTVESLGSRLN